MVHVSADVARRMSELGISLDADLYLDSSDATRRADNTTLSGAVPRTPKEPDSRKR
jgi:hypothetical protein